MSELTTLMKNFSGSEDFNVFLNTIKESDLPSTKIEAIAVAFGSNFSLQNDINDNYLNVQNLLDLAETRAFTEEEKISVKINKMALDLTFRKDITAKLSELDSYNIRPLAILKGYYFLLKKEYSSALFEFSKVNFKKGINMCNIGLNKKKEVYETSDLLLISCIDSTKYKEVIRVYNDLKTQNKISSNNLDFLYRIGFSDEFSNESSIDVQLTNLKYEISSIPILEEIRLKLNYTAEVDYLIGKIYHLNEDFEKAVIFYEKSLLCDKEYLPAEFNLCRIQQKELKKNYECINNYNAIRAMNLSEMKNINLNNCSEQIRKILHFEMKVENMTDVLDDLNLENLDSKNDLNLKNDLNSKDDFDLKKHFDEVTLLNNHAVLKFIKNNISLPQIIEKAISICEDSESLEKLKYNLAILSSKSEELLKSVNLPEAEILRSFYLKEPANPSLKAYLLMDQNPEESIKIFEEFLGNGTNVFSTVCLAHLYLITGNVEKSIQISKMNLSSFYCINCMAVGYAMKGHVSAGIKLLKQIEADLISNGITFIDSVYQNLANCYILNDEYSLAALQLLKILSNPNNNFYKNNLNLLQKIAFFVTDLKVLNSCMKFCSGLEETKAILLIKNGFIQEAKEYIDSEKLGNEIKAMLSGIDKENEIKRRKIQELVEYRKRKNI